MFNEEEKKINKEFTEKGFIIKPSQSKNALLEIKNDLVNQIKKFLKINRKVNSDDLLNNIHNEISVNKLNNMRLHLIENLNLSRKNKKLYFESSKKFIEILVGNELAMQKKISLSIQFPKDDSSLLPVHSDTWSGLSPFEVVVWIPLVDCFKTKAMFILPPKHTNDLSKNFKNFSKGSTEDIFKKISKKIKWIDIKFGEILIFNQHLPHGNRVNNEQETRWSMNCRFKSIFSPYADKKIGEFYEPITLRAASKLGMNYKFPKI
tara:strand:+ start:187 stop:975 length:789 start_codon:yes stop_codon:yes gene_type:complete